MSEWRNNAACRNQPAADWFPDSMRNAERRREATQRAIAVCKDCPVRRDCDQDATGITHGIWAGVDRGQLGVEKPTRRKQSGKVKITRQGGQR
jgi:hypothetical protein